MDDLLELLEQTPNAILGDDNNNECDNTQESRSGGQRNPQTIVPSTTIHSGRIHKDRRVTRDVTTKPCQNTPSHDDTLLDIRMVHRCMPSVDMHQLVHDPAFLSLPQMVLRITHAKDTDATIEHVTLGIVMAVSTTRVSSKGNAFAKVTIGTLRTGPCLDLLLFGSACTTWATQLKVAQVVAVHQPRPLLSKASPASSSSDRTATASLASASINDARYLVLVAHKAVDLARCAAKVKGKDEQGRWVADAKYCPRMIDRRMGPYCQQHRTTTSRKSLRTPIQTTMHTQIPKTGYVSQPKMTLPKTIRPVVQTQKVTHDWLQPTGPREATANKKRRVNLAGAPGVQGSVPVPKGVLGASHRNRIATGFHPKAQLVERKAAILQAQKAVATQWKSTAVPRRSTPQPTSMSHALFDALGDVDIRAVKQSRSKLQCAAEAEDMVLAMQRVQKLEQQEESQCQKKVTERKKMDKQWYCQDCSRPFSKQPSSCLRSNHRVVVQRKLLVTPQNKDEQRLAINEKDLTLGQGLEWSRRNRFG